MKLAQNIKQLYENWVLNTEKIKNEKNKYVGGAVG